MDDPLERLEQIPQHRRYTLGFELALAAELTGVDEPVEIILYVGNDDHRDHCLILWPDLVAVLRTVQVCLTRCEVNLKSPMFRRKGTSTAWPREAKPEELGIAARYRPALDFIAEHATLHDLELEVAFPVRIGEVEDDAVTLVVLLVRERDGQHSSFALPDRVIDQLWTTCREQGMSVVSGSRYEPILEAIERQG